MSYPRIKTYEFMVSLCGGWCNGTLSVEALSYDEAYEKAMDRVADGLVRVFPTLDVEYSVEPTEECSSLQIVVEALDAALEKYSSDNVDVIRNEETNMIDIIYHSDKNSFAIETAVIDADDINWDKLILELNQRQVGYVM